MKSSLNKLKPKANKLHAFVTNWKIPNREKKIELAKHLELLIKDKSYPEPLIAYFKIPLFKELLKNLHEGRISSKPLNSEEEHFEYLPPIEIHNLQILIDAFHSLVHLDYSDPSTDDPFIQAKIYAKNILEYLSVAQMFIDYESKHVSDIVRYLINAIRSFSEKFQMLIHDFPHSFNIQLKATLNQYIYAELDSLTRENFDFSIYQRWIKIFVELNIDPKLSIQNEDLKHISQSEISFKKQNLKNIAASNMHKLLNQTQTILQTKRFFSSQNTPRYTPFDIYDKYLALLEPIKEESLSGQDANELFYTLFSKEKFRIIEAKQMSVNSKLCTFESDLIVSKESIEYLLSEYQEFIPHSLANHISQMLSPIPSGFSILGKPNFLAIQSILGFYSVHCDYLIDLLGGKGDPVEKNSELIDLSYEIIDLILSFLKEYYYVAPQTSFAIIKYQLENLFQDDELYQQIPKNEILNKVQESIYHFLPAKKHDMEDFENRRIVFVQKLEAIRPFLPKNSCELRLFSERLYNLANADIPTVTQMWHAFGEFFAFFQIILSQTDPNFLTRASTIMKNISNEPFIKVLLHK